MAWWMHFKPRIGHCPFCGGDGIAYHYDGLNNLTLATMGFLIGGMGAASFILPGMTQTYAGAMVLAMALFYALTYHVNSKFENYHKGAIHWKAK